MQGELDLAPDAFDGYQSRYIAYCRDRGFASPAEQKAADGNMTNFICWIQRAWAAFGIEPGKRATHHDAFDAWLPQYRSA